MATSFTQEARKNNLLIVGGVGGTNLTIRLYKNNPTVNATLLQSTLVQADFDGYTPYNSALWSAPAIDGGGDAFILSPTVVFGRTSGVTTNTIYGYYVTYDDGSLDGIVLIIESFATPKPMVVDTDQVPLQVLLGERNLAS